jgi:hypothetical protein
VPRLYVPLGLEELATAVGRGDDLAPLRRAIKLTSISRGYGNSCRALSLSGQNRIARCEMIEADPSIANPDHCASGPSSASLAADALAWTFRSAAVVIRVLAN